MIDSDIDLTTFENVFCDSKEALSWAYRHGLRKTAIIRTSSPALLWDDKPNIHHIADFWTVDRMRSFQSSIQKFSEEIFDVVLSLDDIDHEEALCIAQVAVTSHQMLYKAACLERDDISKARLILSVSGYGGPSGNNMNPPWDQLLVDNSSLKNVYYKLQENNWSINTTNNAPFWDRIRLGGVETLVYRLITRLPKKILNLFFNKKVLIASENELIIETAANLALRGINIEKIEPLKDNPSCGEKNYKGIIEIALQSIVRSRIKEWVIPDLVARCEDIFFQEVYKKLSEFDLWKGKWTTNVELNRNNKSAVLINNPVNPSGLALTNLCRKFKIPVIAAQHGVTREISGMHGEASVMYEINASDCVLAFNTQSEKVSSRSHFSRGNVFVSGISARHLRVNTGDTSAGLDVPMVYVSTNLSKGNIGLFGTCLTDLARARNEQNLIVKVLSKLPHNVSYKTYPADNRRYPDSDPILDEVLKMNNIKLYDKKTDMRYLLGQYRILVVSSATSSLTWLIMTGKPVVFINTKNKMPLTNAARKSLSMAVFLFDDDDYTGLRNFLSQPIDYIEKLWKKKEEMRGKVIKNNFTSYQSGAGKRAAKMIIQKYL